jgi:hypothetical protein
MPLKVLFYKLSDVLSSSVYEQLLLDTNNSNLNDKSSIGTQNATLYNQDGTVAGNGVWNYNIYKFIDNPPIYNETGFATIILDDGSIVLNYSIALNTIVSGKEYFGKATCATGIYNSINDVYVNISIFDDLRQITIYYT